MDSKEDKTSPSNENLIKSINVFTSSLKLKFIIVLIVVIVLGIGTGYVISEKTNVSGGLDETKDSTGLFLEERKIVGSDDTTLFKDTATGILKEGGIDGEGAYHLVRPGGTSQNVYLTSSVVDLSIFIEKEIKIWGETQRAQKAGWLMDVGRVEVLK